MGIRKKEYDTFLRKKTEGKQNIGITMISVDGKGTAFPVKLKLQGEYLNKKDNVAVVQSPVYLFCPTALDHTPSQLLDKSNHMLNQANQIFYQTIYESKYFMGQTRYSSKS